MSQRDELLRWRTRASTEFYVLWGLAVATYGIGDIATTIVIVYFSPNLGEGNVLVHEVLSLLGVPGFLLLKLAIFGAGILISWKAVTRGSLLFYYAPPIGMILFGAYATLVNLALIL